MPTYAMTAPNGQTYHIDGPEGANDDEVRAEILRQHPDAETPAAPRSAGAALVSGFGKDARHILQAGGDVLDFVPDAVKGVWNLPGQVDRALGGPGMGPEAPLHVNRDTATRIADKLGLPKDQNTLDRITGAINEGTAASLGVGGLMSTLKGAPGLAGAIGEASAHPLANAVVGATGSGAAQATAEAGGGPGAQTVAAMLGGLAGGLAVHPAQTAVQARFGPKVAEVVAQTPREVVVTPEGELTQDGREIAAHNGLHPDQVKAAYDHFDEVQAKTSNDNPSLPPAESSAVAVGDGLTRPPPEEPVTGAPQEQPPAAEAMRAAPPPETPPAATQRLAEAQSEGVALTKGQATQDFTTQEAEQTLRRMAGTEAGAQAQGFYAKQQQQIADAVDRFKSALGNTEATAEERGAQVQDALRTLRDQGKAGVTSLYQQAKAAADAYGEAGSNLTKLDTGPVLAKLRELFIDESVPDQVRKALKQQAAKYGLLGHDPTTVEGETTVKLKDQKGEPTGRITFTGPVEPLTIANAEAFRQKINALYQADTSKLSQGLKPLIDDAVQQAVERAAKEAPGGVGDAFKAARKAHQQQQATFKAKDVVQNLIDWKKGAQGTPVVSPDAVLGKILGPGPDSVTSLKKVRAVLLSSSTDQSKAAWSAIQAHAVAKVFDKALVLNASAEGPVISGAKLNTAIQAFGVDKLKVLLPKDEFDQLMKLNRIIRNATVPIEGTVNRSGTAYTLMNFLGKQGMKLASVARFIPGSHIVGGIADVGAHIVKSSQQSAKAAKTLRGIREYDLTQAANEDQPRPNAGKFVTDFITTARDPNILAPILAASATTSDKDKRP